MAITVKTATIRGSLTVSDTQPLALLTQGPVAYIPLRSGCVSIERF